MFRPSSLQSVHTAALTFKATSCTLTARRQLHITNPGTYLENSILTNSTHYSPSWEASSSSACQLLRLYVTRKFITVFRSPLSWARLIQYTPSHPISLQAIVISSHTHLRFPRHLFPLGFPNKILYAFLSFPRVLHAPSINQLDLVILIVLGEEYK